MLFEHLGLSDMEKIAIWVLFLMWISGYSCFLGPEPNLFFSFPMGIVLLLSPHPSTFDLQIIRFTESFKDSKYRNVQVWSKPSFPNGYILNNYNTISNLGYWHWYVCVVPCNFNQWILSFQECYSLEPFEIVFFPLM